MAKYPKGIQTKNRIILTARRLFFEKGFQEVTIREIASESDVNLGLINYYFKGKAEIGMNVYNDIRNVFNETIARLVPGMSGVDYFLINSAVELLLSLKNEKYGKFYLLMSGNKFFKEEINSIIVDTLLKYSTQEDTKNSAILSSLSIMSTKPAIVEYALRNPGMMAIDIYLRYYLEAQLYQFGMATARAQEYIGILHQFHIDVGDSFVPVMVPIPGGKL